MQSSSLCCTWCSCGQVQLVLLKAHLGSKPSPASALRQLFPAQSCMRWGSALTPLLGHAQGNRIKQHPPPETLPPLAAFTNTRAWLSSSLSLQLLASQKALPQHCQETGPWARAPPCKRRCPHTGGVVSLALPALPPRCPSEAGGSRVPSGMPSVRGAGSYLQHREAGLPREAQLLLLRGVGVEAVLVQPVP